MLVEQLEKMIRALEEKGLTTNLVEISCFPFNPPCPNAVCTFFDKPCATWYETGTVNTWGKGHNLFTPFDLLELEKFLDAFLRYKGNSIGIYGIYIWKDQMSCLLWDVPEGAERRTQLFWDEETDTWTEES